MLKIALLQISSFGFEQQANMKKGAEYCRKAKELNADIVLFPEMWNIGYTPYSQSVFHSDFDPNNVNEKENARIWQNRAIPKQHEFILNYQKLAKEFNIAIGITYLEKYQPTPRNTISLIDRHGEIVLTYGKVHTCDFSLEAFCTPGDDFFVCDLDTEQGFVKIGSMICFDREFPESARILMLKGAEIILVPNACELEQNRIAQIRTRAYENMTGIAVANYPTPFANGHSLAFDGIAFDRRGRSTEHLLLEAPEEEGIFIAEFDLDKMREYRQKESWGDAYRKPKSYEVLCENNTLAIFKRKDSRK